MRNGWRKPIYKYNLDLKMTYENKWELKPNYKHKWRLKSTYEYKWIMKMDYKYKWDIFLDYMMKKSWYPYFHENKNPCPEFNGEKMHEHLQSKINYDCPLGKLWVMVGFAKLWCTFGAVEWTRQSYHNECEALS